MSRKTLIDQQVILDIAQPLFLENGFNNVEMRTIANQAGIAVGTLYNYFPNKRMLFFEIFEEAWRQVFKEIVASTAEKNTIFEKALTVLQNLYQAMITHRGLRIELLKLSSKSVDEISRIQQLEIKLQKILAHIFIEAKIEKDYSFFLAQSLLAITYTAARCQESQSIQDFQYIERLLKTILATEGELINENC